MDHINCQCLTMLAAKSAAHEFPIMPQPNWCQDVAWLGSFLDAMWEVAIAKPEGFAEGLKNYAEQVLLPQWCPTIQLDHEDYEWCGCQSLEEHIPIMQARSAKLVARDFAHYFLNDEPVLPGGVNTA